MLYAFKKATKVPVEASGFRLIFCVGYVSIMLTISPPPSRSRKRP